MLRNLARSIYARYWKLPRIDKEFKLLSVSETFQTIYSKKVWGDNGEPFCSGSGSYGPASEQYCEDVVKYIKDNAVRNVVDLGCGDYAVGKRIVEGSGISYTGIDVVLELIEYHRKTVHDHRVSFLCADITKDPLPHADLYLIRQVLQHLSNSEIAKVLANIGDNTPALITEDVPSNPMWFNVDKPHGPNVRYCGSGVYIDRAPFSKPVLEMWNVPLANKTQLRTVLFNQVEFHK